MSDILRSSIQQLDTDTITIGEEISLTKKYLDFQKLRFEDKVNYTIEVSPEVSNFKIPSLLLQPLVENSIKHGFEKTGQLTNISIRVQSNNNRIVFDVEDDGPGIKESDLSKNKGTGLNNLKDRLNYFYREDYSFEVIFKTSEGGCSIRIEIPNQHGSEEYLKLSLQKMRH